VHSNYQVGVESKPERSVAEKQSLAARAVFDLAERQSAENKEFKPRPRYAKASLVEFRHLHAEDPGIRMAAQDLYEAAVLISVYKRAGAAVSTFACGACSSRRRGA